MNPNQLVNPNQCEISVGSQSPFPKGCGGARAVSPRCTGEGQGHHVLQAALCCLLLDAAGRLDKPRDYYLFYSTK